MTNLLAKAINVSAIASIDSQVTAAANKQMISFENGYSLSVVLSSGSKLFDVAPMNKAGELDGSLFDVKDIDGDDVKKCTVEEVVHYINKFSGLKCVSVLNQMIYESKKVTVEPVLLDAVYSCFTF